MIRSPVQISRKRESDGALLLQVDAPINPGNSGCPLIDEKGYAHGVNTMILRDTQRIGFAISIETVYEEFQSTPSVNCGERLSPPILYITVEGAMIKNQRISAMTS